MYVNYPFIGNWRPTGAPQQQPEPNRAEPKWQI